MLKDTIELNEVALFPNWYQLGTFLGFHRPSRLYQRLRLPLKGLLVFASLTLAGCIESNYPLTGPESAVAEAGLAGRWQGPKYVAGRSLQSIDIKVQPDRSLLVAWRDREAPAKPRLYIGYVSEISGRRFLNLRYHGRGEAPAKGLTNFHAMPDFNPPADNPFLIARYDLDREARRLTIYDIDWMTLQATAPDMPADLGARGSMRLVSPPEALAPVFARLPESAFTPLTLLFWSPE